MDDTVLIAHLAQILARQGAEAKQAEVMAGQLLKRARQMAVQDGIDEARAVQYLLQVVISSRHGTQPPAKPLGGSGPIQSI